MKKILFVMLSTLMCVSLFAYDESADVVYSADSLSAEVKIGSAYFDGGEHFVRFYLPQNATVKVTQINSCYIRGLHDEQFHIYVNDDPATDLVSGKESHTVGVFVDTIVGAQSFTVWFDNFYSADYSYNPKDPAFTIRYAVINERTSTESILLNGDVEIVSGALTTSGYQNFMGTKVTAILGDDYNEYTCFGSSRGGMIRGSNEGYLILSGNPNGYGNRNVYINRYTSNGDVIMTAGSGQVGIGVDDPQEKLHIDGAIRGNGTNGAVTLRGDSGYVTIGANSQAMEFVTDKSQFVFNKPIYNQSGVYNVQNSNMLFNINGTNRMLIQNNGNIGIGTASPAYKLDVNGTIRANEIIVNTTGADFVFAEDYQLRPLSEVKAFIKENKHLPEIKSAQEMQENGIGVNELQTQLLQKIEELTLYIIHQEERINALEAELNK
jgi:hypothetical protein